MGIAEKLIAGPRVAWSLPLGNYDMRCTLEECQDGSSVLVVTENGQELDRVEVGAPPKGDLQAAMKAWEIAWDLRSRYFDRAMQGAAAEYRRLGGPR